MVGLSWSAFDHARSDQLVAVVPRRELSGGDAPLGPVENEVSPFVADEQPRALQGLTVADADGEPGALPGGQLPGGAPAAAKKKASTAPNVDFFIMGKTPFLAVRIP